MVEEVLSGSSPVQWEDCGNFDTFSRISFVMVLEKLEHVEWDT